MTLWAIVPVKPFGLAKSRLAPVLEPGQRVALSRAVLSQTLAILQQSPTVTRTLVVSRDPAVLSLARLYQANTVSESGQPELNAALRRAISVAQSFGASGVLVLPADLPQLTREDVTALIAPAGEDVAASIAPDRHHEGTNGVFVRPATLLDVSFGQGSFARHLAQLTARGIQPRIIERPGLQLDLDTPADWELFRAASPTALPALESS
ncbi:MAG TPA: 2-phospho-L-lactate guanylyltransferase [Anaerolineales bacterium]|nr:2-phospho-L-lactate guanylyltransferase [Anaerolineales bacterium]HRF49439.1 2-phospho-L-lactate guanylyltransferase [Anaerolineales bacterium]